VPRAQHLSLPPEVEDDFREFVFDWYFILLTIHLTPRRILWWPGGNFLQAPLEVRRVE
jgi:hypothetical protein